MCLCPEARERVTVSTGTWIMARVVPGPSRGRPPRAVISLAADRLSAAAKLVRADLPLRNCNNEISSFIAD